MKYYNKINRNLKVKARLYFNNLSLNRVYDDTPRYFIKIKSLKSLEKIGFTQNSEDNGYVKYAANFYGAKKENYLNETQAESIITDLNSKTPYGYNTGISGSLEGYNNAVKFNYSYQGFYNKFWNENLSRVQTSPSESYSFIEVEFNELVSSKSLVATPSSFADYSITEPTYSPAASAGTFSCDEKVNIAVTTGISYGSYSFYIDGVRQDSLTFGKHKQYTFTNTNLFHQKECKTGVLPFRISTGSANGVIDGGGTLTSGVNVSGAGTLTGSEVLVLTTDENTPNLLWYNSPLRNNMGSHILVHDSCNGTAGGVSHPTHTPYAVWNSGATFTAGSPNNAITSQGGVNHCIGNLGRGWTGYPNSDSVYGITGQSYQWDIPASPALPAVGENTRVPIGAIGVSLNGLPLYNAYDINGNDLGASEVKDECNGFVSSGKYMYRIDPKCTYVDVSGEHSPIIGYAFDGYPIYGSRDESGNYISEGNLDEFHGHSQEGRGYHYHVTTGAPYILGAYYKGVPNTGNFEDINSPALTGYPVKYR